jgi:hypothetical protein
MEVGILLALTLLFFAYREENWDFVVYSGILLLLSLIFPLIFYPLTYVWFGLGKILGLMSSQILLTLLFFVLLMPVGLFRRWVGKDSLQLKKFKQGHDSVLISRNEKILPAHLKNPF